MKKKCIKIFSFLMGICCLAAVGCMNEDSSQSSDTPKNETNNNVICDFEEWDQDFSLLKVFNTFGKITKNEDATYVKSGMSSAKIQPMGQYGGADPIFLVPLSSALYNYNYGDITKYASFGADFYNSEEFDVNLRVGLAFKNDVSMRTEPKSYVLKPGWNRVEFSTLQYPYIFTKPTITSEDYDITLCSGVFFEFDNACTKDYDIDAVPIIYMDDFSCTPLSENQLSVSFEETGELFYNANTTVSIPSYTFKDVNGKAVQPFVESTLTYNGEQVALSGNAFTPQTGGTYVLKLVATYNDEKTEYTYDFVVRNAPQVNEIESFDSKYSLANITGNAPNMKFEYVEDMSATNDGTGCVRVYNQNAWGWPGISVTPRQELNWEDYDYVSYKIYVDGTNMKKYTVGEDGKKYRKFAL